jgi:2-epi-5-epi-valiolone synthase
MTWSVNTSLPVSFNIESVPNVLSTIRSSGERTMVVIDSKVFELYGHLMPDNVIGHLVICEEHLKDGFNVEHILRFFEREKVLRRSEPIYAIGGGVLLDLVGYACSVYRRGIPYIRIPTTLLAIVDASVGAKTGINHLGRRNRLGSYYPPQSVLIDTKFIVSQDLRQISNGIAEILKLALVLDGNLFNIIETNYRTLIDYKFQTTPANKVIDLAISGMISQLQDNLWEKELKRAVDFGHTFSPLIEMANSKSLLHGEAVILDCLLSCCISHNRGLMSKIDLDRVFNTVKNCMLPIYHQGFNDTNLLFEGLKDVTNHRDGNQNIPLVTTIGSHIIVNDITHEEILKAYELWKLY